MVIVCSQLTVFFEEPFWVGVYERTCAGRTEAARIVFGAEPKDYDVHRFLLTHELVFSPPVEGEERKPPEKFNPKRMQRAVQRQLERTGVGTKAQQALKLQQEQNKLQRKARNRDQKEAEAERQYQLHQDKRKEKHRGH